MPQRSKRAKSRRRAKGLGWGEKIAVGAIIVFALWAAYSLSQPPSGSTTTTSQTSAYVAAQTPTSQVHQTATSQARVAPDFALPVVGPNGPTGEMVTLSSFLGKVVLLEFMTPHCGHCRSMVPVLDSLYTQFKPQNVVFLTVSGTWIGSSVQDTAQFIREYDSGWPYLYDSTGSVFNLYSVTGTPTFFIIGRNGEIVTMHRGTVAYEVLLSDLTRING
jgi:thiol-disulfide isomerase/thioredoxin